MIHLSINETAHIRVPRVDMIRTYVIDMAGFGFTFQIMDLTGIFV